MPRQTLDYWDRRWAEMKKDGKVESYWEPRAYKSSLASLEDTTRGSNRATAAGKPGESGGHFKYNLRPGERRP